MCKPEMDIRIAVIIRLMTRVEHCKISEKINIYSVGRTLGYIDDAQRINKNKYKLQEKRSIVCGFAIYDWKPSQCV